MANVCKFGIELRYPSPARPPDIHYVITGHAKRIDGGDEFGEEARTTLGLRASQWWWDDEMPEGFEDAKRGAELWGSAMELVRVRAQTVEPFVSDATEVYPEPGQEQGHGGLTPHSPAVAFNVRLRTDTNTRRGRGRMYFPATPAGALNTTPGNSIGAVLRTEMRKIALSAALLGARVRGEDEPAGTQMVLAVYSRVNHEARAVVRFECGDRFVTQRRRQPLSQYFSAYSLNGEHIDTEEPLP